MTSHFGLCTSDRHVPAFVQALIPLLLYNSNSNCVWARGLIVVFISSLLIGDFLKSLLALPRPPIQRFLVGAERFDADAVDNRDFGWPSTHASNALAVPFFLVHQFGCGVWPLLVGALAGGSADSATAGGFGWTLVLVINAGALAWMLSISLSRMYLGMFVSITGDFTQAILVFTHTHRECVLRLFKSQLPA